MSTYGYDIKVSELQFIFKEEAVNDIIQIKIQLGNS